MYRYSDVDIFFVDVFDLNLVGFRKFTVYGAVQLRGNEWKWWEQNKLSLC